MTVSGEAIDPRGAIREPSVKLPDGYVYGVTRYADVILSESFPKRFAQLLTALNGFKPELSELQAGGGNRTPFVIRFDKSLAEHGWGKRNISIAKLIDDKPVSYVRSHEVDMFATHSDEEPYPGIAVEIEWSNKDPFFDRELINFQALHREGALAVGVIVTRGSSLQELIKPVIRNPKDEEKYGESTTHWKKLLPRVNLGGGGECPLLLIGIEPPRVQGIEIAQEVHELLKQADARRANWRDDFSSYAEAQTHVKEMKAAALAKLPMPAAADDDGPDED